ncbi:MAG: tRNA preQ1(34) S-adenosylmethionine ribosyltransferase-isomerase QueA [Patescibacteria group bacterium]
MKLSSFDYNLPKQYIAQKPVYPRDHSRLMVVDRQTKTVWHRHFFDLPKLLVKGDVLVLNNTKVFPARLQGRKKESGGKIEVFLLKKLTGRTWEVLIGGKIRKAGMVLQFKEGLEGKVIKQLTGGIWHIKLNKSAKDFWPIIDKIGEAPTPPYIKIKDKKQKAKRDYQTVYADKVGSVAAPTAGLHFTKSLLNKLKRQGVQIEYVTLHVGFGTFQPVKVKDIKKHRMHPEWVEVSKETINRIKIARKKGNRVIAVGTTSVRTLETALKKPNKSFRGWVNLFIYPGYKFKNLDALITNFHLPRSTLLMLVSALAGRRFILDCYQIATKKQYRFYSFGDAMLIK